MKYYNISRNIIACENFLPKDKVDELYTDFLNNRTKFDVPVWSKKTSSNSIDYLASDEFFSPSCGGFDFWVDWKEAQKCKSFIPLRVIGYQLKDYGIMHPKITCICFLY